MSNKNVQAIREQMKNENIDVYIIPTADFHESEYVGEFFKTRTFLSGFTGSAGTLIITAEKAGLWTDGRYFIQAAQELKDTGITLYRIGIDGVPSIKEFIVSEIPDQGILGFDGRVVNTRFINDLEELLKEKQITLSYQKDLADFIWKNRPEISKQPAFLLDIKYTGKSSKEKFEAVRTIMKDKHADYHILTTLDDIAWLFNLRGNDILYTPVVLAYALLTDKQAFLYLNETILCPDDRAFLEEIGVTIKPYLGFYDDVKNLQSNKKVLLDTKKVNYTITKNIPDDLTIIDESNPTTGMKCIKNSIELDNLRNSHLKDGVAFTKFMYWLKTNIRNQKITELSASDYLENCRKALEGFIEPSFETISAYKDHAAMMHYSATPENNAELLPEGMLLVDSGGQYYEGTTDITRTIALGDLDGEIKHHFTAVLRGMLNLSRAKFLYGCRGMNLDILARSPLWDLNLDYRCGTGHGVGYLLGVHEPPNGFRWRVVPERNDSCILEEGMVTTNEPGLYIEGSHGIRIENELICIKGEKNEYGQFMEFETITYAPIDLDAIEPKYMTSTEIHALNSYHSMVFDKVSPYLTNDEREWLKHYTRVI